MLQGPFHDRNFRRLFSGRTITNLGDSLYFVGAMWLVHDLTGDPFYTGLAGSLTLIPAAFQFLFGPLIDRWSIRRTLVGTQALQALLVLAIPVAAIYDALSVGVVLVVMPSLATLNELANPAMVAALPRMVEDRELVDANSAISVARKGADMVGNGGAGLLIGVFGAVPLFSFNSLVFAAAAVLFGTMAIPAAMAGVGPATSDGSDDSGAVAASDGGTSPEGATTSYLEELRAGIAYVRGTRLTWLVAGIAGLNFASGIILAAMPAYAETLTARGLPALLGGAGAYGILMAAFTAGTFLGSIATNVVGERPLGSTLVVGSAAAGSLWFISILVSWLPLTALLIVLALLPVGVINIHLASLIQSAPPEDIVGRVTSLYSSISAGVVPLGSLLGGVLAGTLGPRTAMFVVGGGFLGLSIYVLLLPGLRRLPEVEAVEI